MLSKIIKTSRLKYLIRNANTKIYPTNESYFEEQKNMTPHQLCRKIYTFSFCRSPALHKAYFIDDF